MEMFPMAVVLFMYIFIIYEYIQIDGQTHTCWMYMNNHYHRKKRLKESFLLRNGSLDERVQRRTMEPTATLIDSWAILNTFYRRLILNQQISIRGDDGADYSPIQFTHLKKKKEEKRWQKKIPSRFSSLFSIDFFFFIFSRQSSSHW